VQVFRANGDFLRMWGRNGTANGAFQDPRDIAVDSGGRVLVTDTGNKRVQVFARGGRYLTQLTSRNISPVGFDPMGITVDAADRIYIADTDNDRLDMFTTTLT
jgi:DNA-binding beta-propeller fold protein YncE